MTTFIIIAAGLFSPILSYALMWYVAKRYTEPRRNLRFVSLRT